MKDLTPFCPAVSQIIRRKTVTDEDLSAILTGDIVTIKTLNNKTIKVEIQSLSGTKATGIVTWTKTKTLCSKGDLILFPVDRIIKVEKNSADEKE